MIKVIWILIDINLTALLIFIAAYFILNKGKNVDSMERGWTIILAGVSVLVILLAAVPLRFGDSTFSQVAGGFFAALPLIILIGTVICKKLPSLKKQPTFATTYYKDKTQRAIASAIEKGDTVLLKELIKGQDLNIQGLKVWDWPGLNYLQFAIRLRSNPIHFPLNDAANIAVIRLLMSSRIDTTPALAEATRYLSPEIIREFIANGADPNRPGFVNPNPLLFETIGSSRQQNDMAILLVRSGANINATYDNGFTPVMFAAFRAGTTAMWSDTWRLVRYLLEDANANYAYTAPNGDNLAGIVSNIQTKAEADHIAMPPDFDKVVAWLKQRHVETAPLIEKQV